VNTPFQLFVHRFIGVLCLVLSLIGIFVLLHHPTLAGGTTLAVQASLKRVSGALIWVHAGMISISMLLAICMAHYSQWRATQSRSGAWSSAANVIFLIGTVALCLAALINGFVAPAWLERLAVHESREGIASVLWIFNQKLTMWGGLSMLAAIVFWSQDWCWDGTLASQQRAYAALQSLLAIITANWLVEQSAHLGVHAMQALWVVISLWLVSAGEALLRTQSKSAPTPTLQA
jgi:hypothetical protein